MFLAFQWGYGASRENGSNGMFLAIVNILKNKRRTLKRKGWNSIPWFTLIPNVERPYEKYHPVKNGSRMTKNRL